VVSDRSRRAYQRVITDLVARGAEGIILGCTEISLLVTPADAPDTRLYDTTALHVDRAVHLSLEAPGEAGGAGVSGGAAGPRSG